MTNVPAKTYRLLGADRQIYESPVKGTLGGNKQLKIYGALNCPSATRYLPEYAKVRVFFADEDTAIKAGYRPCYYCLRDKYKVWKAGGVPGTAEYPWLVTPE